MSVNWAELWASADHGEERSAQPVSALESTSARPVVVAKVLCTAHNAKTGKPCKKPPMAGATVCLSHGGKAPQVKDAAARRAQEREARALATRMIGEVDLKAYADPFDALEFVTSYSYAFAERLARIVAAIPDDQLRYQGKLGEQLRGEVTAVQRALADAGRVATDSLKLGLAERRAKLQEHTVDVIEQALRAAIEASGADLDGQGRALSVLHRELRQIERG
jgi:hypothetical protein